MPLQRRRRHHLAHQFAALDHLVDILLGRQRVDANFRRVFRAVRRNLDRSTARRPARIECQQETRIRFRLETRLVALRNPVRQRIEVELQVRLRLLLVALEESTRLVHAHRERSLARQQILQAELELAEQGPHFIVQRLHVRAIVEAHAQMILQVLADCGQTHAQAECHASRAAPCRRRRTVAAASAYRPRPPTGSPRGSP